MFLYVDSSALVKRYVDEPMSEAVRALMDEAPSAATALITQALVVGLLAHMWEGRSAPVVVEVARDGGPKARDKGFCKFCAS